MRRLIFSMMAAAITVLTPAWALADDSEITSAIVQGLREQQDNGKLKGFRIRVKSEEGTVWMKGQVATQAQLEMALGVAQNAEGVKLVVNDLSVAKPGAAAVKPAASHTKATKSGLRQPGGLLGNVGKAMRKALVGSPAPAETTTVKPAEFRRELVKNSPAELATLDHGGEDVVLEPAEQAEVVQASVKKASTARLQTAVASSESAPVESPVSASRVRQVPRQQIVGQRPVAFANSGDIGSSRLARRSTRSVSRRTYSEAPIATQAAYGSAAPVRYDHPQLPSYAWPSYAPHPNYAAVTYPKQYSPMAWPYIGPFHPYPQVPLGWRKVTLEWDDGWWMLDFKNKRR